MCAAESPPRCLALMDHVDPEGQAQPDGTETLMWVQLWDGMSQEVWVPLGPDGGVLHRAPSCSTAPLAPYAVDRLNQPGFVWKEQPRPSVRLGGLKSAPESTARLAQRGQGL